MPTADYLSSADLKIVAYGGAINEDVMQQIWDISKIPLPLTDMIGSSTHSNEYTSWVEDSLAAPNVANAAVDGADIAAWNNDPPGPRVGNHSQISIKAVSVTSRAQNSDAIGGNALSYQLMMRQQELMRDMEAIMLTDQASVADNGDDVAGIAGALGSWIKTNYDLGATGVIGGYNTGTGLTVAVTHGTPAAGSETALRDLLQSVYTQGGNTTILMSTPALIRGLSEYLFTSTARVATMTTDVGQAKSASVAKGAVNVFVSDFGVVVELVANRLQPIVSATNHTLWALDPQYLEKSYLKGVSVEPLAKVGTADKRMMSADWTLKVLNEKAQGAYFDINPALAWVA